MAQFDLYRHPDFHGFVLVVQHDLHRDGKTRAAIPLIPKEYLATEFPRLNPLFRIEGELYVLAPQFIASIPVSRLGDPVGSLEHERDRIVSALDFLFTGF